MNKKQVISLIHFIWKSLFVFLFSLLSEIPEKQLREWKALLLHGLPFFVDEQQPGEEVSAELVELQKQDILNNQDYDEYTVSGCRRLSSLQPRESLRKWYNAGKLLLRFRNQKIHFCYPEAFAAINFFNYPFVSLKSRTFLIFPWCLSRIWSRGLGARFCPTFRPVFRRTW